MKRASIVVLLLAVTVTFLLIVRFRSSHRTLAATAAVTNKQMAPDFELQSLDGKTVRLSDFRGKAVLLNFWATRCQPCKIRCLGSSNCRNSTRRKACR